MTIFIGADHRGFVLKNELIEYLQEKNIRVEDLGALQVDPLDDNPDYAKKVAQAVLQNPQEFLGILICGSGAGVTITANRYKGIRASLALSSTQAKFNKEHDDINILSLASDFTDIEEAKRIVDAFLETKPLPDPKYKRRIAKMDEVGPHTPS